VQEQIDFIKQIQKSRGHKDHIISMPDMTELFRIKQTINYQRKLAEGSHKQKKYEWLDFIKISNLINNTATQSRLLSFSFP